MASVPNILLDLSLLPSRGRIAKLCLEQEMAGHSTEAGVDLSELATADTIDGCAHVVVDPPPRDASKHRKGTVVGIEQHLMGLQGIIPQLEGSAVAELEVSHLQLGAYTRNDSPILAPIKLEGFSSTEDQGHKNASP